MYFFTLPIMCKMIFTFFSFVSLWKVSAIFFFGFYVLRNRQYFYITNLTYFTFIHMFYIKQSSFFDQKSNISGNGRDPPDPFEKHSKSLSWQSSTHTTKNEVSKTIYLNYFEIKPLHNQFFKFWEKEIFHILRFHSTAPSLHTKCLACVIMSIKMRGWRNCAVYTFRLWWQNEFWNGI